MEFQDYLRKDFSIYSIINNITPHGARSELLFRYMEVKDFFNRHVGVEILHILASEFLEFNTKKKEKTWASNPRGKRTQGQNGQLIFSPKILASKKNFDII